VIANTAGVDAVADIGWMLFEMEVEYDYIRYDEDNDEITIAHADGLVLLGPGEDAIDLIATDWWQSLFA
jgi:hypothetical protein